MTFTTENQKDHSPNDATKKSRKPSHRCCITCETECQELQEQVNTLTKKLKEAEEESNKLNSLLRLAIYHKLQASNRLKEMNVNLDEVFGSPSNTI